MYLGMAWIFLIFWLFIPCKSIALGETKRKSEGLKPEFIGAKNHTKPPTSYETTEPSRELLQFYIASMHETYTYLRVKLAVVDEGIPKDEF